MDPDATSTAGSIPTTTCSGAPQNTHDDSNDDVFPNSDGSDVPNCSLRVWQEVKGPANYPWRIERRHCRVPALLLQRHRRRIVPFWFSDLRPDLADGGSRILLPVTNSFDGDYDRFASAFLDATRTQIRNGFPKNVVVDVDLAPLAPAVSDRFMDRLVTMSRDGVYPRLLFHGTKAANIKSIHKRGLLPPPLHLPAGHYTDALWTATDPQTSMWYCDCSNDNQTMFGCAVLDPFATVPKNFTTQEDNSSPLGAQTEAPFRTRKPETQRGRLQHRSSRKPTSNVKAKNPAPISRLADSVVLVRDAAMVCPVVQVSFHRNDNPVDEPEAIAQSWQTNPNTTSDDHAFETLTAAVVASQPRSKHSNQRYLRVARREKHRVQDLQRRRLRDMKVDHFPM